jgi:hypothetical protein
MQSSHAIALVCSFFVLPAQPVNATPSAINLFSKGGVYDATTTGKAFREPAERHVDALEGGTVLA